MSTTTIGRASTVTFAFTLLGLALAACEVGPELDQGALDNRGGRKADGGSVPNGTAPATSAPTAGMATPTPPAPSACVMREDGNQVCVVCTGPDGKVVKEGCYTRDPAPPNNVECHEVKRNDGTLCTVCLDAKGVVVKASCRSPEPSTCVPGVPGMDPRGAPVTCKDYIDGEKKCLICIESNRQAGQAGVLSDHAAEPGDVRGEEVPRRNGLLDLHRRQRSGNPPRVLQPDDARAAAGARLPLQGGTPGRRPGVRDLLRREGPGHPPGLLVPRGHGHGRRDVRRHHPGRRE